MAGDGGVEMTAEEIDSLLGRGGVGVLSLARGDEPYATPVSYGYGRGSGTFYLRLGVGEDVEKARFLEASSSARLVVFGPTEDGWSSVIAAGTIEPVEDDDLTAETARVLREGEAPLVDIWGEGIADAAFRIYRLDAESLTGRTTG